MENNLDFQNGFNHMLEHLIGLVQSGSMTKDVALQLVGNFVDFDKVPTESMEIKVDQWVEELSFIEISHYPNS